MEELFLLQTYQRNRDQSQIWRFPHRSERSSGTQKYSETCCSVPGGLALGGPAPDGRQEPRNLPLLSERNLEILLWNCFPHRAVPCPQEGSERRILMHLNFL